MFGVCSFVYCFFGWLLWIVGGGVAVVVVVVGGGGVVLFSVIVFVVVFVCCHCCCCQWLVGLVWFGSVWFVCVRLCLFTFVYLVCLWSFVFVYVC